MADHGSASVAGEQADHGRQVAAGALPHHPERPFGAEFGRVRRRPDHRRVAVLDGGGELVHRREPVVHRHHDGADGRGDLAAEPVPHPQPAAEDEPAAVEVDHQRPRAGRWRAAGAYTRTGRSPPGPGIDRSVSDDPRRGLPEDEADQPALGDFPALQGDHVGLAAGRDRGLAAGHRAPCAQPQIHSCHRTLLCEIPGVGDHDLRLWRMLFSQEVSRKVFPPRGQTNPSSRSRPPEVARGVRA